MQQTTFSDTLLNIQRDSAFVQDGAYRVNIEGFKVINQIPDSYSGVGNRGDNVYVSAETIWLDPAGKPQYMNISRKSLVYGDLFTSIGDLLEPRFTKIAPSQPVVYAGKNGVGLENGENIPCPPAKEYKPELTRDRLPMLLDETEFTARSGMVYLPSIWGWHWSESRNELCSMWKVSLRRHLGSYSRSLFRVFEDLRNKSETGSKITKDDFVLDSSTLGVPAVRIDISSEWMDMAFSGPQARPIGMVKVDDAVIFEPKAIVINSISAEAWASTDDGLGKGVLALEYADEGVSRAKYSLFLKILKI